MKYLLWLHFLVVRRVLSMDAVTKDLVTPLLEFGEACGYMSCPETQEGVINVHIVPSTHGELGYSRTFYEHYTGYNENFAASKINMKNILDATITALWSNDNRKFTLSDMAYLFHWWKNRDGTVRRMVYQLLRQGRLFFVGGGWSMTDEATTSYHAIIDHFTYSLRKLNATFLDCGRPLVTWQCDVFGHSREFASLMAQMGFDAHFINPISYEDELQRMSSKSLEFIWRGSDDLGAASDILTHKLFDGYWPPPGFCFGSTCNDPLIIQSDQTFSNVEERVNLFLKHMTQRQGPYYKTNNVMVIMGQRLGYYDAHLWFTHIDRLIMTVNSNQNPVKRSVNLFYSTPACYLKALHEASASSNFSTKQDDFFPFTYDKNTHMAGMYTSKPNIKLFAREIHHFVQISKQLQIFAKLPNNDKKFEDLLWISGVIQDHTIITGAMRPRVSQYYTRKIHVAKDLAMQIIRPAFNNLRKCSSSNQYFACQFNESSCWTMDGTRFYIVIYNPLSWHVTMPVRLPVAKAIYTVFNPKGEKVNHSVVSIPSFVLRIPERTAADDEIVFIAEKIPPMGLKSYYVQQEQARSRVKRENKREIIKKLTKNKKKKYLTRQTNNRKIDEKSLLDDIPEYEYFEDTTTEKTVPTKMQFGNISRIRDLDIYGDYNLTPTPTVMAYTEDIADIAGVTGSSADVDSTTPSTTEAAPEVTTRVFVPVTDTTTTTAEPIEYYEDETEPPETTTPYFDLNKLYRRMEESGYHSMESEDKFIKNEYIQINFESSRKLTSISLSNGVTITFNIQMCYYRSDDPKKLGERRRYPGPYVFRPLDPQPLLIAENMKAKVIKSDQVEELHLQFANYAGVALKLYKGLPTIEVDILLGPIPYDDGYGKDVFIRYLTNLGNKGVFFTDSNGRQTIKRIRDMRPAYVPTNTDSVAGNFYPVTSKVYIEDTDKNIRFAVFPDRAEGCTSLIDGTLDLMLNRRIFTEDSGIGAFMNETEYGQGLIVRATHHLYVSKADFRPNKVFEKKFAKEKELGPKLFASNHFSYESISYEEWLKNTNEYSALRMKVPIGVHVMTIENWNSGTFLLRLENYLENGDVVRNGLKTVFIKDLFKDFRFLSAKETTLAGNMFLEDYQPYLWKKDVFVKSFNDVYGNASNIQFTEESMEPRQVESVNIDKGIDLNPQQIRTFVITYARV